MDVIEIIVTGSFRAQVDDGRVFPVVEYTEFRFFRAKGAVVRVAANKFYQTAQGHDVTEPSRDGRVEICELNLVASRVLRG